MAVGICKVEQGWTRAPRYNPLWIKRQGTQSGRRAPHPFMKKLRMNAVLKHAKLVRVLATAGMLSLMLAAKPALAQTTLSGLSAPAGSTCAAISVYGTGMSAVTAIKFGPLSARQWAMVSPTEIRAYPPEVRVSMTGAVRLQTGSGLVLQGPEFSTLVASAESCR